MTQRFVKQQKLPGEHSTPLLGAYSKVTASCGTSEGGDRPGPGLSWLNWLQLVELMMNSQTETLQALLH